MFEKFRVHVHPALSLHLTYGFREDVGALVVTLLIANEGQPFSVRVVNNYGESEYVMYAVWKGDEGVIVVLPVAGDDDQYFQREMVDLDVVDIRSLEGRYRPGASFSVS